MVYLYLTMTSTDETIAIPKMNLNHQSIGLIEVNGYYSPRLPVKVLYLCCDWLTNDSLIQGKDVTVQQPVLRALQFRNQKNVETSDRIGVMYTKVLYSPTERQEVEHVRLYLIDESGNIPSFDKFQLKCTLVTRPTWQCANLVKKI